MSSTRCKEGDRDSLAPGRYLEVCKVCDQDWWKLLDDIRNGQAWCPPQVAHHGYRELSVADRWLDFRARSVATANPDQGVQQGRLPEAVGRRSKREREGVIENQAEAGARRAEQGSTLVWFGSWWRRHANDVGCLQRPCLRPERGVPNVRSGARGVAQARRSGASARSTKDKTHAGAGQRAGDCLDSCLLGGDLPAGFGRYLLQVCRDRPRVRPSSRAAPTFSAREGFAAVWLAARHPGHCGHDPGFRRQQRRP
mmetsp:Transcript_3949/g.10002  ORF Transcript_3949/g.10002 Transcript_3949/m.10002 type:complete len:254 (+) Transcript_3949:33-794(+)